MTQLNTTFPVILFSVSDAHSVFLSEWQDQLIKLFESDSAKSVSIYLFKEHIYVIMTKLTEMKIAPQSIHQVICSEAAKVVAVEETEGVNCVKIVF